MVDNTGKLRCTLTCWGVGLMAGAGATVMLGVIGGIGWNGAVFLGALMFVGLGLLLSIVLCRSLPTMAEVQARRGAHRAAAHAPVRSQKQAKPAMASAHVTTAPEKVAIAPSAATAQARVTAPAPIRAPTPATVAVPERVSDPMPAAAGPESIMVTTSGGTKPVGLAQPVAGAADNLKEIKGVGPKLELLLHSLGVFHFSQIAGWGVAEVAWMDDNLEGFRGRVSRDTWVDQARILASGAETAFSQRVENGDVYKDH